MENILEMEGRLWDYIDGLTETPEIKAIEKLIKENKEWREKYKELLQLHQTISRVELEYPSMRFTKNVMEEIEKHTVSTISKNFINNKIIGGIAAFFIITITGFIFYSLSQSNGTQQNNNIGKALSEVNYGLLFNSTYINIFITINILLGLMLIDRYLSSKKRGWINSNH